MTKILLSLESDELDLTDPVRLKAATLLRQSRLGKRFLILDAADQRESVEWILASFLSPLAVAPLNPSAPVAAKAAMISQLPKGECALSSELSLESAFVKDAEKPSRSCWAVIFSSGTSGAPKAVAISGDALRHSALAHKSHFRLDSASWLLQIPQFHIGGFSIVSRSYFLNSTIALSGTSVGETVHWINSRRLEGVSLVPTMLRRLVEQNVHLAADAVRCVLIGGAPCSDSLYDAGVSLGLPLRRTYGMTETSSQIASETSARSGLVALPGIKTTTSPEGEILVWSPTLAQGYFVDGALRPLPLRNGSFPTGDLGDQNNDGLVVEGRKSELIITGGVNVFPQEIERALAARADLSDAAAFSLPDDEWGEKVCLAVVPKFPENFGPEKLEEFLAHALEKRKRPKHVFVMNSIPRTSTGKVLRRELAELVQNSVSKA